MRGTFTVPTFTVPKKYVRDVRDVLDLMHCTRPGRPACPVGPSFSRPLEARAQTLSRPRRIAPGPRRIAIRCIVSVVEHCRAMRVYISLHDTSTLVSSQGDVRVVLTAAPDRRYLAPETMFGFPECTTWSVACLLYKLITGSPLVRSCSTAHIIVGTLRPVSLEPHALDALFDAFDSSVRWRNRAPRFQVPRDATSAERGIFSRALTWSRHIAESVESAVRIPAASTSSLRSDSSSCRALYPISEFGNGESTIGECGGGGGAGRTGRTGKRETVSTESSGKHYSSTTRRKAKKKAKPRIRVPSCVFLFSCTFF